MNIPVFEEIIESNDQTEARLEHLSKLRELVGNVYPNKFERSSVSGDEDTITNLVNFAPIVEINEEISAHVATLAERERPDKELKENLNEKLKNLGNVRVAGRLAVPPRVMGKAAFVHLSDGIERLQIYVRKDDAKAIDNLNGKTIDEEGKAWEVFGLLDHGDFIGVEGFLFLTNTGELSVHVEKLQFLAKAMLPMPDKMHGISDPELQRRYRYADLIASSLQIEHEGLTTREVFERRAKLISGMRRFLDDHGYIEVETPMLTPKATGAAAEPFSTHHNALDIPLFARIAPELYLKRLVVGGFEKVYELNRNFRNEGLSHKHNPEFTMLEFYCAYMDVNGMMDFCEEMLKESVKKATGGSLFVNYDGKEIEFSKFERLSMKKAVQNCLKGILPTFQPEMLDDDVEIRNLVILIGQISLENEETISKITSEGKEEFLSIKKSELKNYLREGWEIISTDQIGHRNIQWFWENQSQRFKDHIEDLEERENVIVNSLVRIFENLVEPNLIQPTFIIDYPKSISPLSKASPKNPQIAERFELFINGMECANGFSELNDPQEQYERFADQMKERASGDAEAMVLDEDYIRALAYGMPPASGIGIGIDRLVMLLTDKHSIRDVILFPHMRPETKQYNNDGKNTEEN